MKNLYRSILCLIAASFFLFSLFAQPASARFEALNGGVSGGDDVEGGLDDPPTGDGVEEGPINLNLDYPTFGPDEGFDLNFNQDLNEMVAWLYYFIVAIGGISTFFALVMGGFIWLTSTGDPNRISTARDRITSAIIGLLIILSSYLILQVINPELTTLQLPSL